jgi:hypothetical protein
VNGQPYAPKALSLGKKHGTRLIGGWLTGLHRWYGRFGEEISFLPMLGFELWIVQPCPSHYTIVLENIISWYLLNSASESKN